MNYKEIVVGASAHQHHCKRVPHSLKAMLKTNSDKPQFEKSLKQLKIGREILLALKTYGPLSTRSLCFILKIDCKTKVRFSLKTLYNLGLVQKISFRQEQDYGNYFYLDPRLDRRIIICDLLKCNINDLNTVCVRHIELPHEQRCARVHHSLKTMFPNAKIYRDYELDKYKISEKVFPCLSSERRVYPDVLLHFVDHSREYGECFIAFEIEESLKSKKRIMDKLQLFSSQSLLDGIVYISTASNITETIRKVFSSKVLMQNMRIKHYGQNFLLFQNQKQEDSGLLPEAFNLEGSNVKISDWAALLMRTYNVERRNSQFRNQSPAE
jgi:predicted transcriptional regulator